jgi:hypothetical protein
MELPTVMDRSSGVDLNFIPRSSVSLLLSKGNIDWTNRTMQLYLTDQANQLTMMTQPMDLRKKEKTKKQNLDVWHCFFVL